ncbi:hypothetical protein SAPIO_CDS2519 [Scedosporium apiospermum]|uniref:Intradiol ring-cleavage dioxygenases domain-containing protein n=1 Tax=Pseudallescheria apiosperma TaxID=563466 RepID=A0A084GCM7_PSEDA|nr:uncharacterized protein SAPIO_CDS2519 [Scedosporium apiospermum]KEZ45089.1 hypothetical protein SAPIO_CDS2519 [Scedosporium apiospermum]
MHFATLLAGVLAATGVAAHPGHDHSKEVAERREYLQHNRRDLSHCAEKMKRSGLSARNAKRRAKRTLELAAERAPNSLALKKRQIEEFLQIDHQSSENYTLDTAPADLFSGSNFCVLTPEVTEGPYYVSGEYVRDNNIEDQEGVFLGLDTQVIDINTCEPVSGVYVEIWHCNSTGVYGGVVAQGNGVGSADPSNIDNTFLRGVQKSDEDGVVTFSTLFPGHYTGRTTHIHVMVHANAEELANGTLYSTQATHVGQVFFDQSLIETVEKLAPYNTNTQELTTNEADSILAEEAATGVDPIVSYVLLGESVGDGLLAWLGFGVDTNYIRNVSAASTHFEDGGVANENGGGFPGGEGGFPSGFPGGPNGTFPTDLPSGALPSGAPPDGTLASDVPTESVLASDVAPSGLPSGVHPNGPRPSGARPSGAAPNGPRPSGGPNGALPSGAPPNGPRPSGIPEGFPTDRPSAEAIEASHAPDGSCQRNPRKH